MLNALEHFDAILRRVRTAGAIVMLDFDGTLAPLVPIPDDARPSASTLAALRSCAERYRVAIISGRALSDIESRVGVDGIWYAGSHGLEWRIDDEVALRETPPDVAAALEEARSALQEIMRSYSGTIAEDKVHCFAVNYRALNAADAASFSEAANAAVAPYVAGGSLRVMDGMRTFEIVPAIDWDKGRCALHMLEHLRKSEGTEPIPLYIGDSITDEDAFRTLKGGITIKVGRDESSAAAYYVEDRDDVDAVLQMLGRA